MRKEKKASTRGPDWKPERFAAFWDFYRTHCRGENKNGARKAWNKLKPSDELIAIMGAALKAQLESPDWKRGVGIPYAATWLNNARWEDVKRQDPPGQTGEEDVYEDRVLI